MTTTLSRQQLEEINESVFKDMQEDIYKYLKVIIDGMKDNINIQVRKVDTASGSKIKIYRYDRYLYRYVCEKIIVVF